MQELSQEEKEVSLPIVPPFPLEDEDYDYIEYSCINGISANLCDSIQHRKGMGKRCGCVVEHYTNLQKDFITDQQDGQ